jgi:hypothetical protein
MGGENSMELPNGVTGFYYSEVNKPPQVDEKQFKQLCFNIVSSNGGKILEFNPPRSPANFYYALVEMHDKRFYILLNEHYPFLAFASAVESGNINFIDIPALFEQFMPFYQVISCVELNLSINQQSVELSDLNRAELEQVSYWKPERKGQVIFNYWD